MIARTHMMRRLVVLAMLVAPLAAYAHDETILGVAKAVSATQLTIESENAGETKVTDVALVASTKILRGDTVVTASDIEVGERVAVIVSTHDEVLTAHEVRLGRATADSR